MFFRARFGFRFGFAGLVGLVGLVGLATVVYGLSIPPVPVQQVVVEDDLAAKVPVMLGVMSRCPDALQCESVFDAVVNQTLDKIDLSLAFIGKTSNDSVFGVDCLHGPSECAGNVQQLCAQKYLSTEQWWAFVKCQNAAGRASVGNPDLAISCATSVGFDWATSNVGQCAGVNGSGRGEAGVKLLKESVEFTTRAGIELSCTVLIEGKPVCIHDGDWKSCDGGHEPADFIEQINDAYEKLNAGHAGQ